MPAHPNGKSHYGIYSTLLFNSGYVAIRCNNALLRLAGNKNQRTLNPIQLRFLG
jgi:hypothetical protein